MPTSVPTRRLRPSPAAASILGDAWSTVVRLLDEGLSRLHPRRDVVDIAQALLERGDHLLAADWIAAVREARPGEVDLCRRIAETEDVADRHRLRYALAVLRLRSRVGGPTSVPVRWTSDLSGLFADGGAGCSIVVADERYRAPLERLARETDGRVGEFLEDQHDVRKTNALTSAGVVKRWFLPDGSRAVSKRTNPQKPAGFEVEQRNIEAVAARLSETDETGYLSEREGTVVRFSLVRPFALVRDGTAARSYALSRWVDAPLLEDLLLGRAHCRATRAELLADYGLLLDALYRVGVLWDGMNPCNILVEERRRDRTYHLLDFEKCSVEDAPIGTAARERHCRDQVGFEELGVLCDEAEIERCLRGYFDPSLWDLESDAPYGGPRRADVAELLRRRAVRQVTVGAYNRAELDLIAVRRPWSDSRGRRRYPGLTNVKIEHYLGCAGEPRTAAYDLMASEIRIAAKEHGVRERVADELDRIAARLEADVLAEELAARLARSPADGAGRSAAAVDAAGRLEGLWRAQRDRATLLPSVEQRGSRVVPMAGRGP